MIFSSLIFLYLFLPVVILLSLFGGTKVRNITLLLASLVFYCWAGVTLVIYLAASILMNYIFGLMIAQQGEGAKGWFTVGIVFNIAFLLVFKYTVFFISNLNGIAGAVVIQPPEWPFVVGISFFTFQAITYLIDVKRGLSIATKSIVTLGLYIAFFPKLIAGPIIRYHMMEGQIRDRKVTFDLFGEGVRRFVIGLGRKVLIADQLALIATDAFSRHATDLSPGIAWIGLAAYALQLYHDFAGYTDMAIGLALIFGFRLPENFNYPYISKTITEFWKRWHITLSEWFRDYLFLPLAYRFSRSMPKDRYGIFRVDQLIYLFAAMITFFLCGLWHGAAWGFVIWGGIHGFFISLERLGLAKLLRRLPSVFSHFYFLLVILVSWVFFRNDAPANALVYLSALAGFVNNGSTAGFLSYYNILFLAAGLVAIVTVTPAPEKLKTLFMKGERAGFGFHIWRTAGIAGAVILIALCTYYLVNSTYSSFIYFRF